MRINNIGITANKCRKPCLTSFNGDSVEGLKRYKHYEELSDEMLIAKSIHKAHRDVQNSGKMRLYRAIPKIGAFLVATSLAITQPGKLSAKAATGLGFLAFMAGFDALLNLAFPSGDETDRKKTYATFGALALAAVGAGFAAKGSGVKGNEGFVGFIKKEAKQLVEEIDTSKAANFINENINPFLEKHPRFSFLTPIFTTIGVDILSPLAKLGILNGVSKDMSEKACKYYENSKLVQMIAREKYNSIDAIEV